MVDLGYDVSPQGFIEAIEANHADIVGMSALLTTTIGKLEETIQEISRAGLRDRVKIMVGGPPVNDEYARQIGADGTAPDAGAAVLLAKNLILTAL